MTKCNLTREEAMSLLEFNPDTGIFTWKSRPENKQWTSRNAGRVAGNLSKKGYIVISIRGTRYYAHRLAWLITKGAWPEHEIDHANLSRADNSISNLREATRSEQRRNQRALKNNKCGLKGVCKVTKGNKWMASIQVNKRQHYLGAFDTPEDAHKAYVDAASVLHREFARPA